MAALSQFAKTLGRRVAQGLVGADAATDADPLCAIGLGRVRGFGDQHIHGRGLKGGGDIRDQGWVIHLRPLAFQIAHQVQHRSFEAGK